MFALSVLKYSLVHPQAIREQSLNPAVGAHAIFNVAWLRSTNQVAGKDQDAYTESGVDMAWLSNIPGHLDHYRLMRSASFSPRN